MKDQYHSYVKQGQHTTYQPTAGNILFLYMAPPNRNELRLFYLTMSAKQIIPISTSHQRICYKHIHTIVSTNQSTKTADTLVTELMILRASIITILRGNYERAKSFVLHRIAEISEYERLAVVTRLRGLNISNHSTDLHVVIFVGYWVASFLLPSIYYSPCMWVTPYARATRKTRGCQLCNNGGKSVITGTTTLKLRIYVGTHPAKYFLVSQLGCDCTYARAKQRSFQISRTAGPIVLKLGILMGMH